jgi:hypothetical protein
MLPSASYVRDLKAAIDTFDRPAVAHRRRAIAAVPRRGPTLTAKEAAGELAALRQKRYFALAESVGAALVRPAATSPGLAPYAQALIEEEPDRRAGRVDAAGLVHCRR